MKPENHGMYDSNKRHAKNLKPLEKKQIHSLLQECSSRGVIVWIKFKTSLMKQIGLHGNGLNETQRDEDRKNVFYILQRCREFGGGIGRAEEPRTKIK
jgi:hypothetical protein